MSYFILANSRYNIGMLRNFAHVNYSFNRLLHLAGDKNEEVLKHLSAKETLWIYLLHCHN